MDVGERLRKERIRFGRGQEEFGGWFGGVSAKTVGNWEKSVGAPDARQLSEAISHGVDVMYLLTGARAQAVEAPPASYRVDPPVHEALRTAPNAEVLNRDALRIAVLQVLAENQTNGRSRTVGDTVDAIAESYERFRAIIGSPIGAAIGSEDNPGTGTEG